MQIDVSVSVDARQPVEAAVALCWAQMFAPPKYAGDKGGPGWESVRHQVLRYIDSLDLTEEIARATKARISVVVDDVVDRVVTAAVKKKLKAAQDAAQLKL